MEGRDLDGPRPSFVQTGNGSFGSYLHRPPSFVGNNPIHAPAVVRHNSSSSSTSSPSHALAMVGHESNQPIHNLNSSAPEGLMSDQQLPTTPALAGGMSMGMGMGMGMGMTMGLSRSEPPKRKRGRPRKYTPTDANGATVASGSFSSPKEKQKRGPNKKSQASLLGGDCFAGVSGHGFTPHVLTVAAGEDVATKIITFSSHGPWAVCILSANGAISNATLRNACISGGAVTYEGRFEILSLSGSFLLTEDGTRSRTGGLSVSLAGPDGRVIGGAVAGPLMAASPVQVVTGTFFPDKRKTGAEASSVNPVSTTGAPSTAPVMQPIQMDAAEQMQCHISGQAAGGIVGQQHASHFMPIQAMDWGGCQFDVGTRGDTESEPSSEDDFKTMS